MRVDIHGGARRNKWFFPKWGYQGHVAEMMGLKTASHPVVGIAVIFRGIHPY
jgi:hypothetical protein